MISRSSAEAALVRKIDIAIPHKRVHRIRNSRIGKLPALNSRALAQGAS
jgi:hypothetical protein